MCHAAFRGGGAVREAKDFGSPAQVVYDRERVKGHGQIWLAKFTEADILAGAFVPPGSTPDILVDAFPFRP